MHEMMAIVARHPEYRMHIALGILGNAIAVCDLWGADAEEFLRDLRAAVPKAPEVEPPAEGQS